MTTDTIPVSSLSIWNPVHLGTDEFGNRVEVTLAERNMLIGGEPGGGKSVALQLIVAHGALSADWRLILIDGKRVELGLWRDCAERFIGPSIDDAIDTMHWLQDQIDERTDLLLQMKKRKVTPDLGWPVYLMPIDEVAYFSATVGTPTQQKEFNAANRDVVARGRAPGIIGIEATQRPSAESSPPACGTCSATGGPSGAAPKRHQTRSSATAGPAWATPPPKSTRNHAACPGSAPKTASPAASRPPTSPTNRSSTSPPGPPKPVPSTTVAIPMTPGRT